MGKSEDVDPWRKHLVEAELELEEKTKQLEDAKIFFCGAITRLAHVASDDVSPLRSEINAIKKAAGNSDDLTALKSAVEILTTRIVQTESVSPARGIASASKATSSEDPTQFCAQLISEILYQLLENISFPRDLSVRLNELKTRLDQGVTDSTWGGMLDQISNLAIDVQGKINRERLDIESFLVQVTARLKDLDAYILGSKEQHAVAWKHGKALGEAVKSEMQHLASNANDALDMDVLKEQIQTRLATIENHVNGFRETEKSQYKNADEEVQRLVDRLNKLETESQNLKARVKKERMQAQIDTLTGIANRLGYDNRIAQECARWKRFNNPLSLVVWDIDFFKRINDDLGHASGDKALKSVAKLLAKKIRETDYIARYGGEEFVLIMPGADQQAAEVVADKLRRTIEQAKFHFKDKPITITISAGIAEFKTGDTSSSVFERADKALYAAKEAGRNQVVIYKE